MPNCKECPYSLLCLSGKWQLRLATRCATCNRVLVQRELVPRKYTIAVFTNRMPGCAVGPFNVTYSCYVCSQIREDSGWATKKHAGPVYLHSFALRGNTQFRP